MKNELSLLPAVKLFSVRTSFTLIVVLVLGILTTLTGCVEKTPQEKVRQVLIEHESGNGYLMFSYQNRLRVGGVDSDAIVELPVYDVASILDFDFLSGNVVAILTPYELRLITKRTYDREHEKMEEKSTPLRSPEGEFIPQFLKASEDGKKVIVAGISLEDDLERPLMIAMRIEDEPTIISTIKPTKEITGSITKIAFVDNNTLLALVIEESTQKSWLIEANLSGKLKIIFSSAEYLMGFEPGETTPTEPDKDVSIFLENFFPLDNEVLLIISKEKVGSLIGSKEVWRMARSNGEILDIAEIPQAGDRPLSIDSYFAYDSGKLLFARLSLTGVEERPKSQNKNFQENATTQNEEDGQDTQPIDQTSANKQDTEVVLENYSTQENKEPSPAPSTDVNSDQGLLISLIQLDLSTKDEVELFKLDTASLTTSELQRLEIIPKRQLVLLYFTASQIEDEDGTRADGEKEASSEWNETSSYAHESEKAQKADQTGSAFPTNAQTVSKKLSDAEAQANTSAVLVYTLNFKGKLVRKPLLSDTDRVKLIFEMPFLGDE